LNIFQNNGVASGQSVPHYHVHVVPRYPGDLPEIMLTRNETFMSVEERLQIAATINGHLPG
jgi:histidine triad (HIT) family protein